MLIKKGSKLVVNDCRKGTYKAVAAKDFDTDLEEFYPIVCDETVRGLATVWKKGDKIPARRTLCRISLVESEVSK